MSDVCNICWKTIYDCSHWPHKKYKGIECQPINIKEEITSIRLQVADWQAWSNITLTHQENATDDEMRHNLDTAFKDMQEEIDGWCDQVQELTADLKMNAGLLARATDRATSAEGEVEKLTADRERLDWLINHMVGNHQMVKLPTGKKIAIIGNKKYMTDINVADLIAFRQAIDQARNSDEEAISSERRVDSMDIVVKCAWCGRYKDGNEWGELHRESDVPNDISHSICPECKVDFEKEIEEDL